MTVRRAEVAFSRGACVRVETAKKQASRLRCEGAAEPAPTYGRGIGVTGGREKGNQTRQKAESRLESMFLQKRAPSGSCYWNRYLKPKISGRYTTRGSWKWRRCAASALTSWLGNLYPSW